MDMDKLTIYTLAISYKICTKQATAPIVANKVDKANPWVAPLVVPLFPLPPPGLEPFFATAAVILPEAHLFPPHATPATYSHNALGLETVSAV